jgi:hypothetical protein
MPSLTQKIRKSLKSAARRVGSLFTRRSNSNKNLPPILSAEEYVKALKENSPNSSAKARSKAIDEAAKALRLQKAALPSPNYPPVHRHRGNKNTSSLSARLKNKLRAEINANIARKARRSRYSNMSLNELERSLEEL